MRRVLSMRHTAAALQQQQQQQQQQTALMRLGSRQRRLHVLCLPGPARPAPQAIKGKLALPKMITATRKGMVLKMATFKIPLISPPRSCPSNRHLLSTT